MRGSPAASFLADGDYRGAGRWTELRPATRARAIIDRGFVPSEGEISGFSRDGRRVAYLKASTLHVASIDGNQHWSVELPPGRIWSVWAVLD